MHRRAMITVPQIAKAMGRTLDHARATAIGNAVRDLYEQQYGTLPIKLLAPKTNGGGSHCHAHYPADWEQIIRGMIDKVQAQEDSQTSLF